MEWFGVVREKGVVTCLISWNACYSFWVLQLHLQIWNQWVAFSKVFSLSLTLISLMCSKTSPATEIIVWWLPKYFWEPYMIYPFAYGWTTSDKTKINTSLFQKKKKKIEKKTLQVSKLQLPPFLTSILKWIHIFTINHKSQKENIERDNFWSIYCLNWTRVW